jgi:hypothetical protein
MTRDKPMDEVLAANAAETRRHCEEVFERMRRREKARIEDGEWRMDEEGRTASGERKEAAERGQSVLPPSDRG